MAKMYYVAGIPCFGPSGAAAQIEASKAFAKQFMDKHGIPTARWKSFTNFEDASNFIMKYYCNPVFVI